MSDCVSTGKNAILPENQVLMLQSTACLVIKQTMKQHDGIREMLSQLRKSFDSVKISCRMMKLSTDPQLGGLQQRCSLHALNGRQRWALLSKTRSEALQGFLKDEKVEVLSCPTVVSVSGQPALVEIGSLEEQTVQGIRVSANPHLVADSPVIRLSHSVTIGKLAKDSHAATHESLVGSGQTLLLLIERPGEFDGPRDRYVLLLTPEHLKEQEQKVEAIQPSAGKTEAEQKP